LGLRSSDTLACVNQPGVISPAASMMFLVALLSCNPLIPRRLSVRRRDCLANAQWARSRPSHPCLLHSSASLRLASLASSIQFPQGTISSNMTTCLEKSDVKIKFGLSVVLVSSFRKLHPLPSLTLTCRYLLGAVVCSGGLRCRWCQLLLYNIYYGPLI